MKRKTHKTQADIHTRETWEKKVDEQIALMTQGFVSADFMNGWRKKLLFNLGWHLNRAPETAANIIIKNLRVD